MARLSKRQRWVVDKAARAWLSDHPHTALEILSDSGLDWLWPTFQREMLASARRRYQARMAGYGHV